MCIYLQLSDLVQSDLDVLALEGIPGLGEVPQLVRVLPELAHLAGVTRVVEGVDEDGRQVELEAVLATEELVELLRPPLLADRRDRTFPLKDEEKVQLLSTAECFHIGSPVQCFSSGSSSGWPLVWRSPRSGRRTSSGRARSLSEGRPSCGCPAA